MCTEGIILEGIEYIRRKKLEQVSYCNRRAMIDLMIGLLVQFLIFPEF